MSLKDYLRKATLTAVLAGSTLFSANAATQAGHVDVPQGVKVAQKAQQDHVPAKYRAMEGKNYAERYEMMAVYKAQEGGKDQAYFIARDVGLKPGKNGQDEKIDAVNRVSEILQYGKEVEAFKGQTPETLAVEGGFTHIQDYVQFKTNPENAGKQFGADKDNLYMSTMINEVGTFNDLLRDKVTDRDRINFMNDIKGATSRAMDGREFNGADPNQSFNAHNEAKASARLDAEQGKAPESTQIPAQKLMESLRDR